MAGYPDSAWGVPLSLDEATELGRRAALQESLGPAIAYAKSQAGYSGTYLDQLDGGTPVFLADDPSAELRAHIAALLPAGTVFQLEARALTYQALAATRDAVVADIGAWSARGIRITSVAVDQAGNAVLVGVIDPSAETMAALRRTYGDALSFRRLGPAEADTCNGTGECWPPKGGIKIVSDDDGGICTSAFVARRTDTDELTLVTAGHCLSVHGGSEVPWTHHGNTIGKSKEYVWQSFTNADVGLIRINDAATADMNGNYRRYLSDTTPVIVSSLTGVLPYDDQGEGYAVCRMGRTSKRSCGKILYTGVARDSCVDDDCRVINMTNEVSFDSTGGDSGGSVFSALSTVGYGLHVHSDPDGAQDPHGWYSPLDLARETLIDEHGVTINWCVTAGC